LSEKPGWQKQYQFSKIIIKQNYAGYGIFIFAKRIFYGFFAFAIMSKKIKAYPLIGEVSFIKSRRARRFTLTVKPWRGVRITLPWHAAFHEAETFLLHHTDWIREKVRLSIIHEKEHESPMDKVEIRLAEEALRERAKAYLPDRTAVLAREHGFSYRRVSIRRSRTRWGSCSAANNINLSLFLMQLPGHLIDYVILHELVHTVHKNHSAVFWKCLEHHAGNAKALSREIRKYRISV
jgi:predicted metal-dependent hydrolase